MVICIQVRACASLSDFNPAFAALHMVHAAICTPSSESLTLVIEEDPKQAP